MNYIKAIRKGRVNAPFTTRQVKHFNKSQKKIGMYTCCGHDGCVRSEHVNEGLLTATKKCLVCPCGKWKQYWY